MSKFVQKFAGNVETIQPVETECGELENWKTSLLSQQDIEWMRFLTDDEFNDALDLNSQELTNSACHSIGALGTMAITVVGFMANPLVGAVAGFVAAKMTQHMGRTAATAGDQKSELQDIAEQRVASGESPRQLLSADENQALDSVRQAQQPMAMKL
jgi:hypothetical protein